MTEPLEHVQTSSGIDIFRIPLEVFPGYMAYAHVVATDDGYYLIDTGSGFSNAPQDLAAGLATIREEYGHPVAFDGLHRVIVTHGHVDHFGGLPHLIDKIGEARVTCHPLARPVLINHDERVLFTKGAMYDFLLRAGVPEEKRTTLMQMYMIGKKTYPPMRVDDIVEDGDVIDDLFTVTHVPGHAPGLIMLMLDDVLLTSDHVLPHTSVALAPEAIMSYTGVAHYVESLEKALQVEGVRVALGGHEEPMHDYYGVVQKTLDEAHAKIDRVREICAEPRTIYEIASEIYDHMDGYGELLRIEQTGARVEYLNQRGEVRIHNLEVLEEEHSPPIEYVRYP